MRWRRKPRRKRVMRYSLPRNQGRVTRVRLVGTVYIYWIRTKPTLWSRLKARFRRG